MRNLAGASDERTRVVHIAVERHRHVRSPRGLSTPSRLFAALRSRRRLRHRQLLIDGLDDLDGGVRSVLEQHYLRTVERPHSLPPGRWQRRVVTPRGAAYRDVEYVAAATVVELDGRLVHDRAVTRWADLDRDLESAVSGQITVRLGLGNVLEPCRTAAGLVRLLLYRGWSGPPRGCSVDCPVQAVAEMAGERGQRA